MALKCLRTDVRAATEGHAASGQGQARVARIPVARRRMCAFAGHSGVRGPPFSLDLLCTCREVTPSSVRTCGPPVR